MSLRRNLPAVILFVALILLCIFAVNWISGTQSEGETGMVRQAVKNAALTCYAVEGAYPPTRWIISGNTMGWPMTRIAISSPTTALPPTSCPTSGCWKGA